MEGQYKGAKDLRDEFYRRISESEDPKVAEEWLELERKKLPDEGQLLIMYLFSGYQIGKIAGLRKNVEELKKRSEAHLTGGS